jgi:hypothetical protein
LFKGSLSDVDRALILGIYAIYACRLSIEASAYLTQKVILSRAEKPDRQLWPAAKMRGNGALSA